MRGLVGCWTGANYSSHLRENEKRKNSLNLGHYLSLYLTKHLYLTSNHHHHHHHHCLLSNNASSPAHREPWSQVKFYVLVAANADHASLAPLPGAPEALCQHPQGSRLLLIRPCSPTTTFRPSRRALATPFRFLDQPRLCGSFWSKLAQSRSIHNHTNNDTSWNNCRSRSRTWFCLPNMA